MAYNMVRNTAMEAEAAAAAVAAAATTIFDIYPDIIQTHILTRLDGATLASTASTCSQLRDLSADEQLWANACHTNWPSTMEPRLRHVISMFPNGYRSFVADSFPASRPSTTTLITLARTPVLISAVDLFHRHRPILSKVVETETVTSWFRCTPFRVDILDPKKDVVQTQVNNPVCYQTFHDLVEGLRLSWIVIDPVARRAMNVSSGKVVSVQRHWLNGEVQVRFATVVNCKTRTATELALCNVVVTLGGENYMHVKEVSLHMEDMDGDVLDGWDSLVILKRALEVERIRKEKNVGEGYSEFVRKKMERWRMRRIGW